MLWCARACWSPGNPLPHAIDQQHLSQLISYEHLIWHLSCVLPPPLPPPCHQPPLIRVQPKQYQKQPTRTWSTRDQRLAARALRAAGFTYTQISTQVGLTQRQVQVACTAETASPREPRGAQRKLSEEQLDEVIEFIESKEERRRMKFEDVVRELWLPVGRLALRHALARRGYRRAGGLSRPVEKRDA